MLPISNAELIEALLARTDLFGGLDVAERAACARAFVETRFTAGQCLFARGDAGASAYLMAEGQVRLSMVTVDGRELSVRVASSGDLIGEIALLDAGPRTADAVALSAGRAFTIGRSDFDRLLESQPQLARAVVRFLCHRLRATTDQLEAIALYSIEARLARFLLVLIGDARPAPGMRVPIELGFSQGELARLLGSSRPKVNMALGALEKAGAVKRTSDRLFCDPAMLATLAEPSYD
jgi:CRP-like cAMP-binding protein